jgi:hypothetical protein
MLRVAQLLLRQQTKIPKLNEAVMKMKLPCSHVIHHAVTYEARVQVMKALGAYRSSNDLNGIVWSLISLEPCTD